MTYLAYAGTSGLDAMNYRLTDPYLDPSGTDNGYSETSLRLADTFWCYAASDAAPEVSTLPALSTGQVTFGCLNKLSKVNEGVLALWAQVLKTVPHSRLLLVAEEGSHRERTRDALQALGLDREQVEFVGRCPHREYLALYQRVDILLDTFPYAGGTTTCDALWMGVPVVSLAGQTAVGRGGVSILSNVELPELVAYSEDEYVKIAVDLANDLPRLTQLRATLRERMLVSPLMAAPRFARNIEDAYRTMWHEYCEVKP